VAENKTATAPLAGLRPTLMLWRCHNESRATQRPPLGVGNRFSEADASRQGRQGREGRWRWNLCVLRALCV